MELQIVNHKKNFIECYSFSHFDRFTAIDCYNPPRVQSFFGKVSEGQDYASYRIGFKKYYGQFKLFVISLFIFGYIIKLRLY